jgi:PAS domain-containing protein
MSLPAPSDSPSGSSRNTTPLDMTVSDAPSPHECSKGPLGKFRWQNQSALRRFATGGTMSREEAHLWRERYRVLFDRNVAGIILTKVDGRIVDCNEPYARILGFDSRHEVLAHSVWDFYFHRAERTAFIDRLRSEGYCPAEEVCLRGRNGVPVSAIATCAVAGVTHGQPGPSPRHCDRHHNLENN